MPSRFFIGGALPHATVAHSSAVSSQEHGRAICCIVSNINIPTYQSRTA
ncbi:hypothetical protein BIFGAL_03233 [Bifidobacterium gallicum DSM 20093 = LMG 11596]|uniref:Uncharacterized protein n=1 Tax=Bifidobacterium gallicum DSM 20093 = LMG 11596 TaxID=561180 RepID=D1NTR7_9BIFI|nr:hypothetical protein BIFGAL_03233 [Bifidobacterium gallicum DSM 20093 = LMG 11596]